MYVGQAQLDVWKKTDITQLNVEEMNKKASPFSRLKARSKSAAPDPNPRYATLRDRRHDTLHRSSGSTGPGVFEDCVSADARGLRLEEDSR